MEKHPYSARMTKALFWFAEERKLLEMMAEGQTLDELRERNASENLLSASSTQRGVQIFSLIAGRIKSMPDDLPSFFVSLDVNNQKLLVLASMMAQDTLFFEFGYEVFRNRLILGVNQLELRDFRTFFYDKQLADEKVRTMTDKTTRRLSIVYRSAFREPGLLKDEGQRKWKIMRAFPDPRLTIYLKDHGLEPIWKVIMGVR